MPTHDEVRYYGIRSYGAAYWVHLWKYVLRVGKPWGPYRYAWRPMFSFFRCWK